MTQAKVKNGRIDWADARRRLAAAADAGRASGSPSSDDQAAILKERARRIALQSSAAEEAGETIDVVGLSVNGAKYAIEASYVHEIVRLRDLTPIPGSPSHISGITNLRGAVLMVIDTSEFFGLPKRGLSDHSYIVVLGKDRAECGLLVYNTDQVSAVSRARIGTFTNTDSSKGREFIKGLLPEGRMLLDGERLLQSKEIFSIDTESAGRIEA